LRRGVQARGARAGLLEQPATFRPCCFDHSVGFALGCGDGVCRIAFGCENPVDRPCNRCIG
jgi:hypothetical protein